MPKRIDPALIPSNPNLAFEAKFWASGISKVAGIDEAGRGALAGPVAAAVVILPPEPGIARELHGVRDSKQMTSAQRESWAQTIREIALAFGVGMASSAEIDTLRIIPATRLAAQRALAKLSIDPDHLLIDYLFLPDISTPQTSLIKGDARSLSIAAASILAKTSRDNLLTQMDKQYPGYGLAEHKGYGTISHHQAIERLGPTNFHRMSFTPLSNRALQEPE
jgi:ribonuclease HII